MVSRARKKRSKVAGIQSHLTNVSSCSDSEQGSFGRLASLLHVALNFKRS